MRDSHGQIEGNAYRNTVTAAPGFGKLNSIQEDWYTDAAMKGFSAEITYDSDIGVITFIPGWRSAEQDSQFSGPGFNNGWWDTDTEQTTYELRLAGDAGDSLSYLVGAFCFEEESEGDNTFNQEFVLPMQEYVQDSDSWAVFTELTWNLADSTRLVTGARYTDDHKEMNGSIDNFITFCGNFENGDHLPVTPPAAMQPPYLCAAPGSLPHFPTLDTAAQAAAFLVDNGWIDPAQLTQPDPFLVLANGRASVLHSHQENRSDYDGQKATYRIALEQDFWQDSMVYISFQTGYRSGGLLPQSGGRYEPEFLDAWTIGTKNRLLGGRLQLNAELFYWEYEDQQISYFALNDNGVLENTTDNIGQSTDKGVDIDVLWLAAENTLLSAKLQYLKASYDDLHFNTSTPRDNIECPYTITGYNAEGDPLLDFNCSGNQSVFSAKWIAMLGIEQTFPMGGMNLIVSLNTTWTDDQVTGFTNLEHEVIESHWRTNLDLPLASADDTWSVSAYARNLEDERRLQSSQAPLPGMATATYGPDMTYGMRFNYNF